MINFFRGAFVFLASLLILGCDTSKNQSTVKPVVSSAEDTLLVHQVEKNKPLPESSQKNDLFMEKLRNKVNLDSTDHEGLMRFIATNNDESQSEEVGYLLYQYLKGNGQHNSSFDKWLSTKDARVRDSILLSLMQILCLDLGEDNYTYERLIGDFPVFKGNEAAKAEFKKCTGSEAL